MCGRRKEEKLTGLQSSSSKQPDQLEETTWNTYFRCVYVIFGFWPIEDLPTDIVYKRRLKFTRVHRLPELPNKLKWISDIRLLFLAGSHDSELEAGCHVLELADGWLGRIDLA